MHASNQLSILRFVATRSTSLPSSDLHRDRGSEDRGEDRGDGYASDPTILLSDDSTVSNVDTADDPSPSVLTKDADQLSTVLNPSTQEDDVNTSNSLLPLKFHPPITFKFPKRKFGASGERSFKSLWCQKYRWLHYDVSSDAAFCYLCMRAEKEGKLLASTKKEPAFISKRFTYWKEATTAFNKHQASTCHKEANEAINLLPNELLGNIDDLLSEEIQEQKADNRKMFMKILQNIRFLARQGLPLRSHEEADSNFLQLFRLRGLDCPLIIEPWMKKKSDKYLSHAIQNECLLLLSSHILRNLASRIRESGCFTIMAVECSDASNKEQLTICIRWVDQDLKDYESFIGLFQVDDITADSLTHAIKVAITQIGLDLSSCRGQCYD